jgi:hypothetical protein
MFFCLFLCMSNLVSSDFWKFEYLKYIKSDDLFVIFGNLFIKQTNNQRSISEVSQIVTYIFWNKEMHNVIVANICKKLTVHKNNNNDNNLNVLLNINPPNPDRDYSN